MHETFHAPPHMNTEEKLPLLFTYAKNRQKKPLGVRLRNIEATNTGSKHFL